MRRKVRPLILSAGGGEGGGKRHKLKGVTFGFKIRKLGEEGKPKA